MKIILLKDVSGVGKRETLEEVADGYALNFLIPNSLAVQATPQKVADLEKRRNESDVNVAARHAKWELTLENLAGKSIVLRAKVNEKGHLYKSITHRAITDEIEKSRKIELPNGAISVKESIKSVGISEAELTLGGRRVTFKIEVKAD